MTPDEIERSMELAMRYQRKLRRIGNDRLFALALARLLLATRPTLYDFVADDAAIILELERRAKRKP